MQESELCELDAPHAVKSIPRGPGNVLVLSLLFSVTFMLAFPPFNIWPLIMIAPAMLVLASLRAARWYSLVLCLGGSQLLMWLWIQSWVREVSEFGWPLISIHLSLWPVLLGLVFRRLCSDRWCASVPLAILVPLGFIAMDYIRGTIIFNGYAWYLMGQPMIEWLPLAQVADLGGQELAALVPASIGGVLAEYALDRSAGHRRFPRGGLITGMIVVLVVGYGLLRIRPLDFGTPGPRTLLVQTNLPASNKVAWTAEQQLRDADRFAQQTLTALKASREEGIEPDLIVWPETMLPGVGLEEESVQAMSAWGSEFGRHFRTFASQLRELGEVPLLLGSTGYLGLGAGEDGGLTFDARFNSVYLVDRALPDSRYDKVHLTPFGERMPIISDFPWLEEALLSIGANGMSFDLEEGTSTDPLELTFDQSEREVAVRFGTPVCFEDTVAGVCRNMVWDGIRKDALLLINLSNDGWFGTSIMGRRMHLQASRFRAIENRVDLLRCVNTGFSAWIDSSGRIRAEAPPLTEASILAQPSLNSGWTVFAAIGQWPSVIVTMIFMAMFVLSMFHPSSS